jgi:hypothetical protein
MGVAQFELEKLLAGQTSVGIAKKLGVSRMDVQRFIGGEASMSMAYALGMLQPQAQDLRDRVEREGAIGMIVGIMCESTVEATRPPKVSASSSIRLSGNTSSRHLGE